MLCGCGMGTLLSDDRHFDRWDSYRQDGYRARHEGNWQQAEKSYQAALKEAEFLKEKAPLATSIKELADVYQAQKNYACARPLYERALPLLEEGQKACSDSQVDLAETQTSLGEIHLLAGEKEQAEKYFKAAFALEQASSTVPEGLVQSTVAGYSRLLKSMGRVQEAHEVSSSSQLLPDDLETQTLPVADWRSSRMAACAAYDRKDFDLAEKLFAEALKKAEPFGARDDCLPTSLNDMARLQLKVHKNPRKAEQLYKRALAVREQEMGSEDADLDQDIIGLLDIYLPEGKFAAAEPLLRRQVAIRQKDQGTHDEQVAQSLYWLGLCLNKMQKDDEAVAPLRRALDIYNEGSNKTSAPARQCAKLLAETLKKLGRRDEAAAVSRQLVSAP